MSGQEITPILRKVFARIQAQLPKVKLMMGDYALDSFVPVTDAAGLFAPYILCKVHTSYETADNGLCGKAEDPLQGSFSLYVVSPDGWVTQELTDKIRATLRGVRLTGTDEFLASGGYSFVDADLGYHRYVQNIGFKFRYNLGSA